MSIQTKGTAPRDAALVVNPRSRGGSGAFREALRELERRGVRVRVSHLSRNRSELVEAARRAVASGLGTIVVGGGDGTISAVVDLLANRSNLTLALVPMGTGNEVARILGIPLELAEACRVVAEGEVATVDLARANGDFFLHTALIGYPAQMNQRVPAGLKALVGRAAYVYALVVSLMQAKPFRAVVAAGDDRWEGETTLVVVGNGRFHRPARILLPHAVPTRGGLVAYLPRDSRRTTLLRLAASLWVARRQQPSLLRSLVGDSVTVATDPPQSVDLDGESGRLTPTRFRLARNALRVLVPGSHQGAGTAPPS